MGFSALLMPLPDAGPIFLELQKFEEASYA
jgi:hypothetical protein